MTLIHGLHLFARNATSEAPESCAAWKRRTVSDHLTGPLLNRKGFDRRLAERLARADSGGRAAALPLAGPGRPTRPSTTAAGMRSVDHLLATPLPSAPT
ncbi:hypothetical protein ACTMU2_28780 [Cupriavidus basilensis]